MEVKLLMKHKTSLNIRIIWLIAIGLGALPLRTFLNLAIAAEPISVASSTTPSPLADAVERCDWSTGLKLIDARVDCNIAQADGMTALHWTVFHAADHAEQALLVLKRLIANGASLEAANYYGMTALAIGCTGGNSDCVLELLKAGADAKQTIAGRQTPLMLAARQGNAEIVKMLIEHSAEINAKGPSGQTALQWAAAQNNSEAVAILIDKGADINQSSENGFTPLMFAAREGAIATANFLIAAGVDVNAVFTPSKMGERMARPNTSALMLAIESGHFELALQLVRQGADPNDQRSGFAPLHAMSWTRKANSGDNVDGDPIPRGSGDLTSLQFVHELVASGADVNCKIEQGTAGRALLNTQDATPFLMAARTADLPLLKLLFELGADPKATNADGTNAVMAAAGIGVTAVGEEAGTEQEVVEVIHWLCSLGVDVNAVDKNLETAMHGAAYRNFPLAVDALASDGAFASVWDHKNKYNWTPIMIAEGYRPGSFKPSPETIAALKRAMQSEVRH